MPPRKETAIPQTMEELVAALHEQAKETSGKLDMLINAIHAQTLQTQADTKNTHNLLLKIAPTTEPPKNNPPPNQTQNRNPPQIRSPKLVLNNFDGTNPLDWLFQADQYFTYYKIDAQQRLELVAFHLAGDALSWFKYLHNNKSLSTWEAFTVALQTRFGPSTFENHQAALFKLRQQTTVTAYVTEFERLSNCIIGLPQEALLNCFISGLRNDIQQELAILKPATLQEAVGIAKLVEDKLNAQRFRPRPTPPFRSHNPPPITTSTTPSPTLPSTQTPQQGLLPTPPTRNTTIPFRNVSSEYTQQRRAAGLCFKCPEK